MSEFKRVAKSGGHVVSCDYVGCAVEHFPIDPELEKQIGAFHVTTGRFLATNDQNVAVLDEASARSLGVSIGDSFPVRTAADTDLRLTVIGILGSLQLQAPPLATVPAPALQPSAPVVTSGVFIPMRVSE